MQRRWAYLMRLSSRPALLLIFVQMISGMRDMPQFSFFLIYLREQLAFAPETISSVVAGGQVAGTIAALLGGSIATRLGSKSVLVSGLRIVINVANFGYTEQKTPDQSIHWSGVFCGYYAALHCPILAFDHATLLGLVGSGIPRAGL